MPYIFPIYIIIELIMKGFSQKTIMKRMFSNDYNLNILNSYKMVIENYLKCCTH